ncbi:MAG TPA: FAD-linked oxidase C-terminal domain-containing protein, partial [Gammaproteobacteria bacterium]|nr:FAD-linked oxidase C-terminal domain-containing protein [Gammaproteobacteria bacterium]
GTRWRAASCTRPELDAIKAREDTAGHIHREVDAVVTEHRDEIARVFPDLNRYLSGYNLAQIYDTPGERFNLNKLICGSEGTLALVAELKLRVLPLPKAKTLFALRYDSFDDALRDAEKLVAFEPSAIESLDDKVMGLARENPIYTRVRDFIENADGSTPDAVNLVEFSAGPDDELDALIAAFRRYLAEDSDSRSTGFYHAEDTAAMAALWDLRKAGVGLLGSTPGDRKPLPFVEDTVVDPRVLADYVHNFRAILDSYGLEYGMFGHIDVGCLHVRPALNLCDPDDERIMREVMDKVEALVRRYGGLVWNEHGKGYRSEYNPDYFGGTLYAALGRIKTAFDPHNQLNPGKVVVPADDDTPLASMRETTRGAFDRQIPAVQRQRFATPIACNGNGACFNYDPRDVMCPSYRVTRDRLHSPKGRAAAMREWLRQVAATGVETLPEPAPARGGLMVAAARDTARTLARSASSGDFSHQVWTAMDGCLSCRACASECPVKVDVPGFKSRFLALYHSRYPRPLADYAMALLEPASSILARAPGLANTIAASRAGRAALTRWIGISDVPAFSRPSLYVFLRRNPEYRFSRERFCNLDADRQARTVFIVQDAFTSFFDADVPIAVVRLLARLGYQPMVLPFKPNGKALQVKGFLPEFQRAATRMAAFLQSVATLERPLIGIEPSVTLSYREEYPAVLGRDALPDVQLLEEWLTAELVSQDDPPPADKQTHTHTLLQHCTVATNCPESTSAWQRVFSHLGLSLGQTAVGCCGMSGAYGHETRHQWQSRGIYGLSWAKAFRNTKAIPVVPGYSCRTQIRRFSDAQPAHPAQVLLDHVDCVSAVG